MAKSLLNILSQIERLQKEAAAIQSEVITRIRKDIVKYSLTVEQLFGSAGTSKPVRAKAGTKLTSATKPPKYADGTGNTWGGMGKRPEWIRQALAAGKALEDFLVGKAVAPATADTQSAKARAKPKAAPARKPEAKKRTPAKTGAPRKPRAKPAAAPAEA